MLSVGIPLIIGFLGSFFTMNSVSGWYQTLIKPSFNPPSWIFGPVWTVLYILMGISLYLILTRQKKNKLPLAIFSAQLFFNGIWSFLFFGMHNPLLALIDILVMWVLIVITIVVFHKISKLASYLLIPYIMWVSFATVLNYFILVLNP